MVSTVHRLATAWFAGMLFLAPPVGAQDSAGDPKAPDAAKPAGPPPAIVGVDKVRMVDVDQTVPVIGRFVTRNTGIVAARVSGPVEDVHVEVGDRVLAGDLLVELDDTRFALAITRLEALMAIDVAAVRSAEADIAIKQVQYDRQERLRNSAAYSGARLEDSAAELARAKTELAQKNAFVVRAEADLAIARADLADSKIRAPYSGTVIVRQAQPGAYLSAGAATVTLLDDTALEIEADVPSGRIRGLTPGRQLSASIGTETIGIVVRSVIPDENPATRTRAVRFSLSAAAPAGLAQNQAVTVAVPVSDLRDALSVHKDAVIQGPAGAIVYLVSDGKAARQPVDLGTSIGSRLEVLSGLADGDLVVIRGNERLRPGQPVSY